ncbi:MAG: hypothetical protein PHG69_01000 [Candidatus Omnitrophica bacterium]|nr:hypothetical protein [Candidatus Omnitrophota bacterium]
MKKITLIISVFIMMFIVWGLCFAAVNDNYERTTQEPEGKSYIINKTSDKDVELFQSITDLLSLQNRSEYLNTNIGYSSDAVATPDAIGSSVFGIYPHPPDNPAGGSDEEESDVNPSTKEIEQELQSAEAGEGAGTSEPAFSTPETGNESEINLGAEGEEGSGLEVGEELIDVNDLSIK